VRIAQVDGLVLTGHAKNNIQTHKYKFSLNKGDDEKAIAAGSMAIIKPIDTPKLPGQVAELVVRGDGGKRRWRKGTNYIGD
jgi:hypothetical protein